MINILKENKKLKKELAETKKMLEEERAEAINLAAQYEEDMGKKTPEYVVEQVLREELDWFSLSDKSVDFLREYYSEAQNILNNQVFINEVNKYTKQLIEGIAKRAKSYNEVEALRYSINGVQVIKDRLKDIPDPDAIPKPKTDNIHSAL